MSTPSVLFVCVKNGGKSQMAASLMRAAAGDTVTAYSAGTKPGTTINALAAEVLLEVGVDITDQTPTPVDPQQVRDVDLVVTLGREARLDPVAGTRFENWTPTSRPNAASTESNGCGWSATTSPLVSPTLSTDCTPDATALAFGSDVAPTDRSEVGRRGPLLQFTSETDIVIRYRLPIGVVLCQGPTARPRRPARA